MQRIDDLEHNQQSNKMDMEPPAIQNKGNQEQQQYLANEDDQMMDIDDQQDEQMDQQIEEQSQKMIQMMSSQLVGGIEGAEHVGTGQVKNPVSAYMVFFKCWREDHPNQKMNLAGMGALYKTLSQEEKRVYLEKFKVLKADYDQYRIRQQANNPSTKDSGSASIFPLHRVRCIMKQDKFYHPKAESVAATAKATELFGEFILEEVKKMTEGKTRVTSEDLYECIGNKNKILGFLECLIDEKTLQKQADGEDKKTKSHKKVSEQPKMMLQIENDDKFKKAPKKQASGNKYNHKVPSNQIILTDMFKNVKK